MDEQWQSIVDTYTRPLLHMSYLYVKDFHAAEDIVQDVFVTFFEKQTQFREQSSLQTYLTRMTINRSKDYLKSWRYRTHQLTNYFTASYRQKNDVVEEEERLAIAEAVLALPMKYREMIILYFYEHYTLKEIAALLHLAPSTVHYRFQKAQQKLKIALSDTEWELLFHE